MIFPAQSIEDEAHRQTLAFSISHNHQSVRIYGYYPAIDGKETKICLAINQLPPKLSFDVPALYESTGLLQGLESHLECWRPTPHRYSMRRWSRKATPDTAFSKSGSAKKRKSPVKI
ncbi:hypothetical protein F5B18DRAFT_657791 [Nemania serpens]|nr:hypothetical protein F5B18DRAFT_657791 [Nemania serpens]